MIGTWVHNTPISKPCYWDMTDENLECPRCRLFGIAKWQGYLPLYGDDGKPLFTTIALHHRPQVLQLLLHQSVTVRKGNDKYDTVVVEPVKPLDYYQPGDSDRRRSADLLPFLIFTLWKQETDFINFVIASGELKPTDPLPPPPAPPSLKPAASATVNVRQGNMVEQLKARIAADAGELPPTVGEVLPKTNGYHPKKS